MPCVPRDRRHIPMQPTLILSTTFMLSLREQFGDIDIYLFDQLLRGRFAAGMRVLDAGCGGGRNLVYLLRAGYDVCGVDGDGRSIDEVRRRAGELAPDLPPENFRAEPIEH